MRLSASEQSPGPAAAVFSAAAVADQEEWVITAKDAQART